jgi:hypothetical protein
MNRRTAFKNLAFATGSLILLPSWMVDLGLSTTTSYNTGFSLAEQGIIASITDAIIPKGNAVGALDMGVDKYLQKLIEECYEPEIQENVKKQLKQLDINASVTYKTVFTELATKQQQLLLGKFETSADKSEKDFFQLIKSQTIRGFTTSQKIMTEYLGYKVAPGHYYGSVPVKA